MCQYSKFGGFVSRSCSAPAFNPPASRPLNKPTAVSRNSKRLETDSLWKIAVKNELHGGPRTAKLGWEFSGEKTQHRPNSDYMLDDDTGILRDRHPQVALQRERPMFETDFLSI